MQKILSFLLSCLVVPLALQAQSPKITVTGVITDAYQEALVGVSILQKRTSNGTLTDINGNFSLYVDQNAPLIISYMGYAGKEVKATGDGTLRIVLEEDNNLLDEVVVVGFGTQKRRDIVGAISSVSAKDVLASGQTDVLQALQGSVPGLRIDNPASPSGTPSVRIRGLNSLTSTNNNPLYVVDGIPFTDMQALDPNDIQSIEVLKDASATAIYGSQAANGVLLITTKRGSSGKATVNASFSYASQNPMTNLDLMNGEQYIAYRREIARTKGTPEDQLTVENLLSSSEYAQYMAGLEVDPYEMMLNRDAPLYEASVSVSGGEKTKYYISGNYMDREGLIQSSFFKRFSIRANLDIAINDYIHLSNNTNLYEYKSGGVQSGDNGMSAMYRLSPYSTMYNDDGTHAISPMPDDPLFGNPLSDAFDVPKKDITRGAGNVTTLTINIPWVDGLSASGKYSFDVKNRKYGRFAHTNTKEGQDGGKAVRTNSETSKWYAEGLLAYKRDFGKHSVDLTAMMSAESEDYETHTLTAVGIPTADYLWYQPEAALNPLQANTGYTERRLIGSMFRANYNFQGKYYATFTVRRDGFSGFSKNQKYATFPSFALAWRINEENFLKSSSAIDNLKLRVSYGKIGSQGVNVYETLAKLSNLAGHVFGQDKVLGYMISGLENDLKWETTTAANVGLDYAFLNNRIFGSLEMYQNVSDDLLVERNIPIMHGVSTLRDNAAKVQNKGFEINLTGVPVRTADWELSLGVNYSYNKNEILEVYGEKKNDIGNRWFIGEPIGVVYSYRCLGIWQEDEAEMAALYGAVPGQPKMQDVPDEDGNIDYEINDKDRQIIGTTVPPHLLGIRTALSYKNFTLSVYANGAFGHVKRATYKYLQDGRFRNFNFDYWTPETPGNAFPRPGTISGDEEKDYGSLFTYKADWFKIKNVTLNYDVPSDFVKQAGIQSLSLYCSLQDYFSFYSFPFIDPETGGSVGSYPNNKQIKFGVRLSF
ncbi:MAG: TonB-dependent receptor [Candidatus Azobacteroides sp.]|nr:TonB-dependent receptor [Candidatus Azobacteroides sp.]